MNLDGSAVWRLSDLRETHHWDNTPSASLDDTKILFVVESASKDILVMNANGTNTEQITNAPSNEYSPSWSPDGEYILFVSDRDDQECIYIMPIDGDEASKDLSG